MSDNPNNLPPLAITIVGAGTVGGGVLQLLRDNAPQIAAACGRNITVSAIAVRDVARARNRLPQAYAPLLTADWRDAAKHPKADIVLELMGGEDDAGECIKTALAANKAVVTANKALLAARGDDIFAAARNARQPVAFEAAITGCIPTVKILREALAGDNIDEIAGIINGTCNHIISAMSDDGITFDDALADAAARGYAEADASLDIDGVDAAHKIALMARLAFNAQPQMGDFLVVGVRGFDLRDVRYAAQFGFCVKLLAHARQTTNGVELSVQPTLIARTHPMAAVGGAMNAVLVHSVFAGETMYYGAGAGGHATAVAVVADVIDIARGNGALTMRANDGGAPPLMAIADLCAPYYLRLRVLDKPGVLAKITGILAAEDISIEAIHQNECAPGQEVDVIILLHDNRRGRVQNAVNAIEELESVFGQIIMMPIRRFLP